MIISLQKRYHLKETMSHQQHLDIPNGNLTVGLNLCVFSNYACVSSHVCFCYFQLALFFLFCFLHFFINLTTPPPQSPIFCPGIAGVGVHPQLARGIEVMRLYLVQPYLSHLGLLMPVRQSVQDLMLRARADLS